MDIRLRNNIWIAFILLFVGVSTVSAQEKTSLQITPPTFELVGNPGDVIRNSIRLDNISTGKVKVQVYTTNFGAVGEEGSVGLTEENSTFSLAKWINVEPKEVTLDPATNTSFNFTVTVPNNAEPGGHFGSIVFRTVPDTTTSGSGAIVQTEIGSLLLLKIAGTSKEGAKLVSFNPEKNFYEYGPVVMDYRTENSGNVHVKPVGKIKIKDMLGRIVAELPLDGKNVLPGAIRRVKIDWNKKWLIGKFEALLVMTYGSKGEVLSGETSFWVIPYKLVAGIGIILLTLVVMLFKGRKRLRLAWSILSGKTKL